jgi:alkanesulfonate monooxygenase SsuD/methylene tetrahydromethanopterin reductase-like flavin-dependent oxidoreductase (luciferase family)
VTVKLGMFTMPFHHPSRDYATILEEDREAIVLADRLGFSEVFVGEHFSSWSERTMDVIKRGMIIAGSPPRVLDQLVALRDEIGPFGTLLMAGHDWDQPKLWRRSMELLATEVMPRFSEHASMS